MHPKWTQTQKDKGSQQGLLITPAHREIDPRQPVNTDC